MYTFNNNETIPITLKLPYTTHITTPPPLPLSWVVQEVGALPVQQLQVCWHGEGPSREGVCHGPARVWYCSPPPTLQVDTTYTHLCRYVYVLPLDLFLSYTYFAIIFHFLNTIHLPLTPLGSASHHCPKTQHHGSLERGWQWCCSLMHRAMPLPETFLPVPRPSGWCWEVCHSICILLLAS